MSETNTASSVEIVLARHPDATVGIKGDRWGAEFTIVRLSEKDKRSFFRDRPIYGRGETMEEAWDDAAARIGNGAK